LAGSASKIQLKGYDDLFAPTGTAEASGAERIQTIALTELFPFPNHPFKVKDDEDMQKTVESITEYGVLHPALARPQAGGGYQLISGHRRKRACEIAGIESMPVVVRNLTDDEAAILMVDSNIQRERLDPSELAKAYKIKLEALKRQGARSDLTSRQVGEKSSTVVLVGKEAGESARQIHRYVRLTELIPDLLDMVDGKQIAFNPAVELSYLKPDEQAQLVEAMDSEQATPSLSQAQRLKRFSQEGNLTPESIRAIMSEEKKPEISKITIPSDRLTKYFPKSYTPQRMEETIFKLLEQWHKRQHEQAR
jgi:ParB family chromosome partitioning protein